MDYKKMAEDFGKSLLQSSIYADYCEANEKLHTAPALKAQMDEYRLCLVKMQMAKDADSPVSEDEQMKVSSLYSQLMVNEQGADFLEKERKMIKMLKEVAETIYLSVPLDVSFIQ